MNLQEPPQGHNSFIVSFALWCMKLEVPFYPQTSATNCGAAALQMVLAYFGKQLRLKQIEDSAGIEPGKGLHTIQLALAARRLGFSSMLCTKSLGLNPAHKNMEFYKKYSSMNESRMENFVTQARAVGIRLDERSVGLKELLSYVHRDSLALVLLDWNMITKKEGYQGHFVPVVGYDEEFVYVHNPGLGSGQSFVPLKKTVFDEARKAQGTDEDVLVITR